MTIFQIYITHSKSEVPERFKLSNQAVEIKILLQKIILFKLRLDGVRLLGLYRSGRGESILLLHIDA